MWYTCVTKSIVKQSHEKLMKMQAFDISWQIFFNNSNGPNLLRVKRLANALKLPVRWIEPVSFHISHTPTHDDSQPAAMITHDTSFLYFRPGTAASLHKVSSIRMSRWRRLPSYCNWTNRFHDFSFFFPFLTRPIWKAVISNLSCLKLVQIPRPFSCRTLTTDGYN